MRTPRRRSQSKTKVNRKLKRAIAFQNGDRTSWSVKRCLEYR
ncbi:MAG: hypothetical protein WBM44_15180 [Waterburya sp.]